MTVLVRMGLALGVSAVLAIGMTLNVSAAPSVPIETAKAKAIVELDKQVTEAIGALAKNAPGVSTRTVEDLRNALNEAVKAAYPGLTTTQGITYANELIQKLDLLNRLEASKDKDGVDKATRELLTQAAGEAKASLEKTVEMTSEAKRLKDLSDERFAGFNFGVAMGVIIKAGKRNLVQSASLDPNGLVRIERDNDTTANLILESHYFFTPDVRIINVEPKNWGIGPFIAVQPGTDNIIQSIGGGLMVGFKRASLMLKDVARDRGDSFNLGFGVMVNPNSKVLGDGIQKNQPLPGAETVIRLKTTTEMGYLVTFSYSF